MKHIVAILTAALLIAGLVGCKKSKAADPEMQAFIDMTLSNLVLVEGGTFIMGDAGREVTDENGNTNHQFWTGDADTHPAHKVTLDSYSIQKHEVTYGEYDYFSKVTERELHKTIALGNVYRGPDYPVWGITWQGAKEYCDWLGEISGLPFDLPSEAQWEYAARSRGLNVPFATDNGLLNFGRNYAGENAPWHPEPPGTYPPNPLGIFDMSGNVSEWVKDWYSWNYYQNSPEKNPQGPKSGSEKIMRGFGVVGSSDFKQLYRRAERSLSDKDDTGIRCVINRPDPVTKN